MIVSRPWDSPVNTLHCATAMEILGIRIVSILFIPHPTGVGGSYEVWGASGCGHPINLDRLDELTDKLIDGEELS